METKTMVRSSFGNRSAATKLGRLTAVLSVIAGMGLASAMAASAAAQAPDAPTVLFGRGVAQRFCGQCHAVGEGPSPFEDAPPFRDLHLRYRAGGLDALLKEGMLTPDPSMEEGNMPGHPRMPQRRLDIDERAALAAYLRSLEPQVKQ